MKCNHCGAENPSGSAYCVQCGAPLSHNHGRKKKKSRKKWMFVLVPVTVLMLVLLIPLTSGRKAGDTAEKLIKSFMEGDAQGVIDLVPEEFLKTEAEEAGITLQEEKEMLLGEMEPTDLKGMKISAKADHDSAYGDEEKNDIISEYQQYGIKVKDARKTAVMVTMSYLDDKLGFTMYIPLIQLGRDWYVDYNKLLQMDYDFDNAVIGLLDEL